MFLYNEMKCHLSTQQIMEVHSKGKFTLVAKSHEEKQLKILIVAAFDPKPWWRESTTIIKYFNHKTWCKVDGHPLLTWETLFGWSHH